MIAGLALGAPGIYELPPERVRALTGVRMDITAFVGVAPRGPARRPVFDAPWALAPLREDTLVDQSIPVVIDGWDEYVRLYGAFEGPGLLPYAVSTFFENGGQRAYIVRIVHRYTLPNGQPDDGRNAAAIAAAPIVGLGVTSLPPKAVRLRARDEGIWGNALSATLNFTARPVPATASGGDLLLSLDTTLRAGDLLRVLLPGLPIHREMRFVTALREEWDVMTGARRLRALLDMPLTGPVQATELVTGTLVVNDGAGRVETLDDIGFSRLHPRWLARVIVEESDLVYPGEDPSVPLGDPRRTWIDDDLLVDAVLSNYTTSAFTGGTDRYADITPSDFFDDAWTLGDDEPGAGVHALTQLEDLSLVVAPDLYSPGSLPPLSLVLDTPAPSGDFELCAAAPPRHQTAPVGGLDGLLLDPQLDFETIIGLQQRLVALADSLHSFVVLLDVPPRLDQRRILDWRSRFTTAFAAAYHPWLEIARLDERDALVRVNPAAVAAGIIAQREIADGVQTGPANVIAASAVNVDDVVSPARAAELHHNAINLYRMERDGVRLTAARTLSRDRSWRQLSVRRLVTMLERALDREMQWAVFEPNGPALWNDLSHLITVFLRQLYRANAFAGDTEQQAFFVHCDETLNPPEVLDAGRLITEVGVAPAEPLEFIVLQLARDGDGTLRIQEQP